MDNVAWLRTQLKFFGSIKIRITAAWAVMPILDMERLAESLRRLFFEGENKYNETSSSISPQ